MTACVVFMTVTGEEEGLRIGRALVDERLAACCNLASGLTSIYRWEGAVHEDPELLLIAKTVEARVPALTARVHELHSYKVPEVIALPVTGGSDAYLQWVEQESRP